ncbi:ATP-dependent RNA helicase RhlE [compost metagenome]
MGFIHDVKKVLARLPAKRQNLLFSATFSKDITDLADKLLHNPERIEVTPPNTTVERIEQRIYRLPASHKRALLAHLITLGAWEQVLVFTRTKHGANRLAEYLEKHGLSAAAIHGNKSQNARTKALADFKANSVRVLVATDIAARGLDIDQLPHVVNFELPNVEEDYVHRIGRTGRAGRSGEAISLVAPDEEKLLKSIERVTRQKIPDGDLMGFDASQVEVEKPEVRERPQNSGRGGRNQQARGEGGKESSGGRKDKGKDKGKAKQPAAEKPAEKEKSGERQQQPRKPRDKKPREQQASQNGASKPSGNRDPEVFLDDDVDNFGNRADYVSPYQNAKNQGRNRRPGTGQGQGQGQASGQASGQRSGGSTNSGGQGRTGGGQPRNASGEKRPRSNNAGGGARRDGGSGGGRGRPAGRDDAARQEPAVRSSREPQNQPVIIRKESKLDRYPTPEQLDDLPSRPRGERPALLTRNR